MADAISVLDYIPGTLHAGIRAKTSTTDVSSYIQAAIDYIDSIGGGLLLFSDGRFTCGSAIDYCKNLLIRGAGKGGTVVVFTHQGTNFATGSGFKQNDTSVAPLNGSTAVHFGIEDISVQNTHSSNLGALVYDQSGTFIHLRNVGLFGGKYGVAFDQTELADIDLCDFEGQVNGGAGLWLVNGGDISGTGSAGFTNRISVSRCQFNQSSGIYAVVDDGGIVHSYTDNNINGGGMRLAGVEGLAIRGGEFESVAGVPILAFYATTRSGGGCGGCRGSIADGVYAAVSGQAAISCSSAGLLVLLNNTFSVPSGAGAFTGAQNVYGIFSRNNVSAYAPTVPLFDGYATAHDDSTLTVRTESGTSIVPGDTHYNSLIRCTAGTAITYTVPADASWPVPVGTTIGLEQAGSGTITVAGASGVTINSRGSLVSSNGPHSRLRLEKTGANRWLLSGDRA